MPGAVVGAAPLAPGALTIHAGYRLEITPYWLVIQGDRHAGRADRTVRSTQTGKLYGIADGIATAWPGGLVVPAVALAAAHEVGVEVPPTGLGFAEDELAGAVEVGDGDAELAVDGDADGHGGLVEADPGPVVDGEAVGVAVLVADVAGGVALVVVPDPVGVAVDPVRAGLVGADPRRGCGAVVALDVVVRARDGRGSAGGMVVLTGGCFGTVTTGMVPVVCPAA